MNAASPTGGRRDSWAGYAEVRIPVTGPDMNIAGLNSLEITAAGRYETFQPGGDSAVPKVGAIWRPIDEQVAVRGTYSQSFVAPTTFQLFGGDQVNVPGLVVPLTGATNAPSAGRQEFTVNVSNNQLKPVDAENWGFGIVVSPKCVKGLTLSADYYHVKTRNDIFRLDYQTMVDSLNSLGSASPFNQYYLKPDGSHLTTTAVNQANDAEWGVLNAPLQNGAAVKTDGIDLAASYKLDVADLGRFTFFANANVLLGYKYQDPIAGGPFEYKGQYTDANNGVPGGQGTLPDYLINAGVTWDYDINKNDVLSYTVNATYIPTVDSPFTSTLDGSAWKIDSWYRIDMQLSYEIGRNKEAKSWYDGTRLTIGCNNVTDNLPPLIGDGSFEDNTDKSTYDIIGRFIYLEVAKKF